MTTLTWSIDVNHFAFKTSRLSVPLNRSLYPFSQGDPGYIWIGLIPIFQSVLQSPSDKLWTIRTGCMPVSHAGAEVDKAFLGHRLNQPTFGHAHTVLRVCTHQARVNILQGLPELSLSCTKSTLQMWFWYCRCSRIPELSL